MRIAYMLTSLGRGGAERQVIALAERMAARGHHVVLIVLKPSEVDEWPTSLELIRLDMRKSLAGVSAGLLRGRRHLRRFRPEIVHSHTFPANMAARILHAFHSTPAVLSTIHNIYEGRWWRTVLYRVTDILTAHTTAVSEAVAKRQVETGAVTEAKCSVITNGIDTGIFKSSAALRYETRAKLNAADQFVWLAAGRLTAAKDYPCLLQAFSLLYALFPNAVLWIAGQGSVLEQRRLQARAKTLGIAESVRWLGLRDDMPSLLDAADGFVLSSAWEGMPLVVGEAMAMEKPVVATDVGGVRELIGDAGLVVPPNVAEALAEGMRSVMRMPDDQRRAMGRNARTRIQRLFDIDAKADDWHSLYTELLRNKQR
jgi:glycosyltransferase involved in cell wall biosynthesis